MTKITEKTFNRAIDLFNHGITPKTISDYLDIGYSTACRIRQAGTIEKYREMTKTRYESNVKQVFKDVEKYHDDTERMTKAVNMLNQIGIMFHELAEYLYNNYCGGFENE